MITTTAEENTPVKQPILKINKAGTIVLFTELNTGTVVHFKDNDRTCWIKLGFHSTNWDEMAFSPYGGFVTLETKEEVS